MGLTTTVTNGEGCQGDAETGLDNGRNYADDVIVISDVIKNLIARKYGRTERLTLNRFNHKPLKEGFGK